MVYQNGSDDCGKAAVRNYLSLVLNDDSFLTLPLERMGDFLSMRKEMSRHGVVVEGRLVKDVLFLESSCYPLIAQILYPTGRLHFLVVKRRIGKKLEILDGEFGNYYLDVDEFSKIYTGKVLVLKTKKKAKKKKQTSMLSSLEKCLYFALFAFQSVTLSLLFYYLTEDVAFEFKVFLLVFSFLLFFFQVLLNRQVRKRMDEDILIPFLEDSRNYEDFVLLSQVISETVERTSSIVSYGTTSMLSLFVFMSNGYFVLALGFVSILFSFLLYSNRKRYCKINRECSLKEEMMRVKLKEKGFQDYFRDAQKIASGYGEGMVAVSILEGLSISVLIVLEMAFGKKFSLNFYLFYLFLGISFSTMLSKILQMTLDESKKLTKINALSLPLEISVKTFSHFVYNKREMNGGASDAGKPTYPRLPRQHTSEEETE